MNGPSDWNSGRLSEFFSLRRGYDLTEKDATPGRVPVYSSSGISYYHNEFKCRGPGVVTGRKGSVGRVYYIDEDYWPHDTTLFVDDFKGNHPEYVWVYLIGMRLERFDAATSVPTLNRNNILSLDVSFPPLPEQKKIARILSTWDKAIELLEKKIEAKEKLKKGLMQQLLTGKKRFKEFGKPAKDGELPEGWTEVKLGDVVELNAKTISDNTPEDFRFKYIDIASVGSERIDVPDESLIFRDAPSRARRLTKPGDILFSTVRPNLKSIAIVSETGDLPWVCSTGFSVITPRSSQDLYFIFVTLFGSSIERQVMGLIAGSNYPAINGSDVAGLRIAWPGDLQERMKIGAFFKVLSRHSEVNEAKVQQLRFQKKGLMQQLLTGKKRVKV